MKILKLGNCEVTGKEDMDLTASEMVELGLAGTSRTCRDCRTQFELEVGDKVTKHTVVVRGDVGFEKLTYYAECPRCEKPVYLAEDEVSNVTLSMPRSAIEPVAPFAA